MGTTIILERIIKIKQNSTSPRQNYGQGSPHRESSYTKKKKKKREKEFRPAENKARKDIILGCTLWTIVLINSIIIHNEKAREFRSATEVRIEVSKYNLIWRFRKRIDLPRHYSLAASFSTDLK